MSGGVRKGVRGCEGTEQYVGGDAKKRPIEKGGNPPEGWRRGGEREKRDRARALRQQNGVERHGASWGKHGTRASTTTERSGGGVDGTDPSRHQLRLHDVPPTCARCAKRRTGTQRQAKNTKKEPLQRPRARLAPRPPVTCDVNRPADRRARGHLSESSRASTVGGWRHLLSTASTARRADTTLKAPIMQQRPLIGCGRRCECRFAIAPGCFARLVPRLGRGMHGYRS